MRVSGADACTSACTKHPRIRRNSTPICPEYVAGNHSEMPGAGFNLCGTRARRSCWRTSMPGWPARRVRTAERCWARVRRLLTRRRMPWRATAITAIVVAVAAVVRTFCTSRADRRQAQAHAPISILVADFTNHTGEPVFDGTLEPAFNVAMEGASFVNAFNRGDGTSSSRENFRIPPISSTSRRRDWWPLAKASTRSSAGAVSRRGDSYSISARSAGRVGGKVHCQSGGHCGGQR